mmetsp:Transcript_70679/g.188460  ORF Transcript_70679/g.188460 Transcript_70679/m.188460 type:complete len:439 (-) Transcript_70679:409-1725(-)
MRVLWPSCALIPHGWYCSVLAVFGPSTCRSGCARAIMGDAPKDLYLLFESAAGYALILRKEFDGRANDEELLDAKVFTKAVKLVAFQPFATAEEALEQINAMVAGEPTDTLMNMLDTNLPSAKKGKGSYQLGVYDVELGRALSEKFPVAATTDSIRELLRACRVHFGRMVKALTDTELGAAHVGLAHSYSRNKLQDDPNRQDKPIINAIALLDAMDKNLNTFAMRVKEWYSWHFPELGKIVTDNVIFAKAAMHIRLRSGYGIEEGHPQLAEICGSEDVANEVVKSMRISMGQDIVELDMKNIDNFAMQVVKLANMREALVGYLKNKMDVVAPNLSTLIGERVAARLISHAGSLTNLAKYPASTVQILGAEKALFRALKTKGNTPKYGLIFHSTFIGRAAAKNKGRVSRYLANKCSLASRIDCFSDQDAHTNIFGEKNA